MKAEVGNKRQVLKVSNTKDFCLFGYGGNASAAEGGYLFLLDNVSGHTIAGLVDTVLAYPDPRTRSMLRESRPGHPDFTLDFLYRPILYTDRTLEDKTGD